MNMNISSGMFSNISSKQKKLIEHEKASRSRWLKPLKQTYYIMKMQE